MPVGWGQKKKKKEVSVQMFVLHLILMITITIMSPAIATSAMWVVGKMRRKSKTPNEWVLKLWVAEDTDIKILRMKNYYFIPLCNGTGSAIVAIPISDHNATRAIIALYACIYQQKTSKYETVTSAGIPFRQWRSSSRWTAYKLKVSSHSSMVTCARESWKMLNQAKPWTANA